MDLVTAEHRQVVLMGHSTGGLITALWASTYHERIAGLVLNSPWLELQGSAMVRTLGTPVIDAVGVATRPGSSGCPTRGCTPGRCTSATRGSGTTTSPSRPRPPRPSGPAGCEPSCAGTSTSPGVWGSRRRCWSSPRPDGVPSPLVGELRSVDSVLDVEQIAARAPKLGRCVTVVRIPGGMHDLVLSAPDARARTFAEIDRWAAGYLAVPAAALA